MDYKSTTVNFSENQKAKVKSTFKKNSKVNIQFYLDQIKNGKDKILLTKRKYNKLEKRNIDGNGVKIEFSYNQLKENQSGGLLNELLELVKNNIPHAKKKTPIIRKQAAIKDHVIH